MPWKVEKPMDQKMQIITFWKEKLYTVTELSEKYGISRKTVYKFINRYLNEGLAGLEERSRSPLFNASKKPDGIRKMILEEKIKHITWGPKKIVARLRYLHPNESWPAPSTAGEWLADHGLVNVRKKRKRVPPYTQPFIGCTKPNDSWSIDYKGQFKTKNKRYCYPFTITDNSSRFLLACDAFLGPRYNETKKTMERVFREHGLPKAIRSDNGTPFASKAIGGLSKLSIWLIKLGITPERIDPGAPQQNGRHERMHRTLKDYIKNNIEFNCEQQQLIFNKFQHEYNFERPHESLDLKPPAFFHENSYREYPEKLPEVNYDLDVKVRKVKHNGDIKFKGTRFYLSELLSKESVGLKEIDNDIWEIFYGFHSIGAIDLRKLKVIKDRKVLPMCPV